MKKRTQREWRRLVREFESGGRCRRDFCEAHGLSMATLDYWRRRVRSSGGGRLVEVEVADAPASVLAVSAGVTITWPNGVVVALPASAVAQGMLEGMHRAFGGGEPCLR
ncbi:MAG: IS66 family insertion sequence element accessory protein TnpA [Verrucomicrobiales bacterium]